MARVNDLMRDLQREVFVDSAVEEIMARQGGAEGGAADSADAAEAAAAARVAAAAGDDVDEAVLVALGIAAACAADAGDALSARRLAGLRAALVDAAAALLPPEARVLDAAARAEDGAGRRAVVERALGVVNGGGDAAAASSDLPLVGAGALYAAACHLVDDVESRTVVPDAALLARLVLARDDVRSLAASGALPASSAADVVAAATAHGGALHSGAAALVRALVAAPARGERLALLRDALTGDAEREAAGGGGDAAAAAAAQLAPRPGRVLAALGALRAALAARGDAARAALLDDASADAVGVVAGVAYPAPGGGRGGRGTETTQF